MSEALLEVENLVRHYTRPKKSLFGRKPVVKALNGVSFDVREGESFGIVGESGSGKSTLARALLALEEPTAGSVHFKGENLFALAPDRLRRARRHIQMVFQDPFGSLDPKHKVRTIVTEPMALVDGVDGEEREARAAEALEAVGLKASDLDKYPHEFSGGQRQRIAIARALITRPDLIVADEPVSALDVSVQAQVLNLMMDLQQQFDLTYIIISHDLSVVRHVTDRIAVMQAGEIVEQGDTAEIFESPSKPYTRMLLDAVLDVRADDDDPDEHPVPSVIEGGWAPPPAPPLPEKAAINDDRPVRLNAVAALEAADAAIASALASVRGRDYPLSEAAVAETPPIIMMPDQTSSALQTDVRDETGAQSKQTEPPIPAEPRDAPQDSPDPEEERTSESGDASGGAAVAVPEKRALYQGQHLIDGVWLDGETDRLLDMTDPSDGGRFGLIARGSAVDVDLAVEAARRALDGAWGRLPAHERGRKLVALAERVLDNADHLARLEAEDVGTPLRQARADALALARYFEFYGSSADKVGGQTLPCQNGHTVLTLREPRGVTGHIVPWHDPMPIIGRSVGAALAMGNACVLKPGEDASRTALEVGRLALEADLPAGALNIVTGLGEEAGAALAAHPGVDHLSFTGSAETGKLVQQAAATHSRPVTLELDGKSPQIVFADADLEEALPFLVSAAIRNGGHARSAGSRLLIQDEIYDDLVQRLAERFEALQAGPATRDLDCGPVINKARMARIEHWLERAESDRIPVLAKGTVVSDAPEGGFYIAAQLLGDVPADHPIAREDLVGPVLAPCRFADEEAAVRLASDTRCGPIAGIWTRDGARQMRLARRIRTDRIVINDDGGAKSFGFGRERGFEALCGFSTLKTVAIRHG